jgi:hypothetical protein
MFSIVEAYHVPFLEVEGHLPVAVEEAGASCPELRHHGLGPLQGPWVLLQGVVVLQPLVLLVLVPILRQQNSFQLSKVGADLPQRD